MGSQWAQHAFVDRCEVVWATTPCRMTLHSGGGGADGDRERDGVAGLALQHLVDQRVARVLQRALPLSCGNTGNLYTWFQSKHVCFIITNQDRSV